MVPTILTDQFIEAIDQARRLYVDGVIDCFLADPRRKRVPHDEFLDDLQQRFACLMVKAFVETAESDLVWTPGEAELAKTLVEHVLRQPVRKSRLKETFRQLSEIAKANSWAHVTEPMTWFEQTRTDFEELKSTILRVANIAAKVDGQASPETIAQVRLIGWQLDQFLGAPRDADESAAQDSSESNVDADKDHSSRLSNVLIQIIDQEAKENAEAEHVDQAGPDNAIEAGERTEAQREAELARGLEELDALIGIANVRHEVRTLVNLCKLQQHRAAHEMPVSPVSLHMVFTGNPGTGKTTVARIIGKLFGAMGIIERGHLVETDRSGLVAEYLGQTAQKTSAKIDEAIDGVLFIDEAYSLASDTGPDAYGLEAIQTLLKRMEDDRERLVVILAGYPEPMDRMLKSNPGLSSRFSRHCHFPDYTTGELAEIFDILAEQNRYRMTAEFRTRLAADIQAAVDRKDEHFGNGRMVRNLFENAIRNLANRVVAATDLTPELLSTFQPDDLQLPDTASKSMV